MIRLLTRLRFVLGALALIGLVAATTPAGAQQPAAVNPTASSVKEDQLLRQLGQVAVQAGQAGEDSLRHSSIWTQRVATVRWVDLTETIMCGWLCRTKM